MEAGNGHERPITKAGLLTGLGGLNNGIPTEAGFDITPASEIMAILCLSKDMEDMEQRIGRIVVAHRYNGEPFTVNDLGITGPVLALLRDAIEPNLVQTTEHNPVLVHGGPFANIAHGCNSAIATRMALTFGDYVVTEAGFGADLGARKILQHQMPSKRTSSRFDSPRGDHIIAENARRRSRSRHNENRTERVSFKDSPTSTNTSKTYNLSDKLYWWLSTVSPAILMKK